MKGRGAMWYECFPCVTRFQWRASVSATGAGATMIGLAWYHGVLAFARLAKLSPLAPAV